MTTPSTPPQIPLSKYQGSTTDERDHFDYLFCTDIKTTTTNGYTTSNLHQTEALKGRQQQTGFPNSSFIVKANPQQFSAGGATDPQWPSVTFNVGGPKPQVRLDLMHTTLKHLFSHQFGYEHRNVVRTYEEPEQTSMQASETCVAAGLLLRARLAALQTPSFLTTYYYSRFFCKCKWRSGPETIQALSSLPIVVNQCQQAHFCPPPRMISQFGLKRETNLRGVRALCSAPRYSLPPWLDYITVH